MREQMFGPSSQTEKGYIKFQLFVFSCGKYGKTKTNHGMLGITYLHNVIKNNVTLPKGSWLVFFLSDIVGELR
jgi:hypothetical protein